ncbi:RecT-like ssDNA binding protein [Gordonia phage Sidious]|uniref:RecT-like ssDNA binding protein n=1 Tax=Gordonia phage Sidious TaxID=2591118 RepID=A0A515MIH4_9CAUD|nr:RecT-like ssDNA binding protein [Gordonia phage Sidious]QDM56404.1 RecT-like ssDNA binding protein [Gordonia phage Sidious]
MTTDVAHTPADDSLSVLPPAQPMQSQSVAQLMEHAKAMNTAYELAEAMCGTALVPSTYRGKPQDGTAAILYGAELGLTPIQSLQQIFVVHGTPAIYARTMVALLKSRGYRIWTEASSDESVTVLGEAPDGTAEGSTWTIERAEKAGYVPTIDDATGKYKRNANDKLIGNEKYLTDPQAMLYAKAAAEVCRRLAPDVLLGIAYTREDLESETPQEPPRRVANEATAPGVDDLRKRLGIAAVPKAAPEPAAPATAAAEAVGESTESDTAAPSKDDLKRFTALFARAGITGNSAAAKAKRKTVTEKLIERTVEDDTPLTADECLKVVDQLEALVAQGEADGRGDAPLVDTVTALIEESATQSEGA